MTTRDNIKLALVSAVLAGLVFMLVLGLTGCATLAERHEAQWPTPRFDYVNVVTQGQADAAANRWLAKGPGYLAFTIIGTGSMEPYMDIQETAYLLVEPLPLLWRWDRERDRGLVVVYEQAQPVSWYQDRFSSAPVMTRQADKCVVHVIIDVGMDGTAIRTAGTNNKFNDPWQVNPRIHGIVRHVVRIGGRRNL